MLGIILILFFLVFLIFVPDRILNGEKPEVEHSERYEAQMDKLWSVAQSSMKERKVVRAEKALLTILKFDEKNAAAYNRLGILYAKSQKFDEAIECFEIAQSLDSNPSSLHNAGLIYLETGAFEKAAMAFKQAIEIEGDIPARFIALAKAEEKLGNKKAALEALESAFALDCSTTTLRQILALHEAAGDSEAIAATTARIERQIAANIKSSKKAPKTQAKKVTSAPKLARAAKAAVSKTPKKPTARSPRRPSR